MTSCFVNKRPCIAIAVSIFLILSCLMAVGFVLVYASSLKETGKNLVIAGALGYILEFVALLIVIKISHDSEYIQLR